MRPGKSINQLQQSGDSELPGTVLETLAVHNVPFIPHQRIERRANGLIARFFEKSGKKPGPPIPIDRCLGNDLGDSLS